MKKQHTLAVAGSAAAIVLGAAMFTGSASAGPASDPAPKQSAGKASAKAASVACNGGKVVNMKARTSATPFSFTGTTSASDVLVPGAQIQVRGPRRGKDTLLVTFSAETYYNGSSWMGVEVHLDGTPIQPYDNGSPYAMNAEAEYAGASAQFCTKVGKGRHTLEVRAYTAGGAATDSGWIDDYTFSVIRFD